MQGVGLDLIAPKALFRNWGAGDEGTHRARMHRKEEERH